MKGRYGASVKSALLTVGTLFGGILAGIGAGNLVFTSLPGHSATDPSAFHVAIAAVPFLLGLLAGGAGWGLAMGRLVRSGDRRRMAMAGMMGFVPITLLVTFGLLGIEPIAVEKIGGVFPIHRLFTFLFVPSAFLIAGISAWALGKGLGDDALARSLLWKVGLTAAVAFLVVDLLMEVAGWVVGAPGAGERATMITVMSLGNFAAALAGGGLAGFALSEHAAKMSAP